jgi:hypothetical protein
MMTEDTMLAFDTELADLRRIKMFRKIDGQAATVAALHVTPSKKIILSILAYETV